MVWRNSLCSVCEDGRYEQAWDIIAMETEAIHSRPSWVHTSAFEQGIRWLYDMVDNMIERVEILEYEH